MVSTMSRFKFRFDHCGKFPLTFFLLCSLVLVACATPHSVMTDLIAQLEGRPAASAVHVAWEGGQARVYSYGQVSGSRLRPVHESDRVILGSINSARIQLHLVSHREDQDIFGQLDLSDARLVDAAAQAISAATSAFAGLADRPVSAYALLAPVGSGRSIAMTSDTANGLSIAVAVMTPQHLDRAEPVLAEAIDRVTHELFHVHHRLIGTKVSKINEETAAYLIGLCARSWFAQALEVELEATIDLSSPRMANAFPGIEHQRFAPNMSELDGLSHASAIGRTMALAALTVYGRFPTTNLGSSSETQRLLSACNAFATRIPDFSGGELE